jgi:hypothetical protein
MRDRGIAKTRATTNAPGGTMTPRQRATTDWRKQAEYLVSQLNTAHSAVESLGVALDAGDMAAAKSTEATAYDAVAGAAQSAKRMRTEQVWTSDMDEMDVTGSTLVIGAADVATVALDVMVNAMMGLTNTKDDAETDFLVSTSMDAEDAYEVGAAVVQAAPEWDEPDLLDLDNAFRTDGNRTLVTRVRAARPRVLSIKDRARDTSVS